jgi:hypothetical protein
MSTIPRAAALALRLAQVAFATVYPPLAPSSMKFLLTKITLDRRWHRWPLFTCPRVRRRRLAHWPMDLRRSSRRPVNYAWLCLDDS